MSKYSNDNEIMININNGDNFSDWVERKYLLNDFQNIDLKKLKELIPQELLVSKNDNSLINSFVTYIDSRTTFSLPCFLVVTNRNNEHLEELLNYINNSFNNSRSKSLDLIKILLQLSGYPNLVEKYIKIFNQLNFKKLNSEEMGGLLYSASFNCNMLGMIKVLHQCGIDCNSFNNSNLSILHMVTDSLSSIFYFLNQFKKEELLTAIKKNINVAKNVIDYVFSLPGNKLTMDDIGYKDMTPKMLINKFYSRLKVEYQDIEINEYNSLIKYVK